MKEKRIEKKGIYAALLMLMMLSGGTSLVWGQPVVAGNRVEITSGTASAPVKNVYGGEARSATMRVEGNTVILSSMRVGKVYGGEVWGSGTAIRNIVVLRGLEDVLEAYGGWVGYDSLRDSAAVEGRVEGNEVIATDTAMIPFRPNGGQGGFTGGDIYGGKLKGKGIAAGNKVTLRNVRAENNGDVGGGWVLKIGAAIENEVEINGGRWKFGAISGGSVGEGRVEGNRVILNDVRVGHRPVHGGVCGGGTVTGNTVTLRGAEIGGDVSGGCVTGIGGTATGNEVNIEGNVRIGGTLYGGCIRGKHFSAGERGHVRVTITDPNTGRTFNVRPSPEQIEERSNGGCYVRIGDAVTGNTLNLRHCFLRVETVKNFEYINLYMNQDEFLGDNPIVTARQEIDLQRARIRLSMNITDQSALNDLRGREKVLMRSDIKVRNYSPSSFTFSIEGDVNRDSPRPQVEVSVRGWSKMLVAKIKGLVLPGPVSYTEPEVHPFERMNDLSKIRIDGCCCNVA
jgi:hypothetical protein